MFRRFLAFFLCFLLLAGCSPAGTEPERDVVQEHYAQQTEFSAIAHLRTDFGDRVVDFSVRYTHRLEGQGEMEVLAPEIIQGIRAKVSDGDVALSYEGLVLELGALPGTGLSPMESLPLMVWDWSRGYLVRETRGKKEERTLLTRTYQSTREGVGYEHTTVFDEDTLRPVSGELYIDGVCVVSAVYDTNPTLKP